MSTSNEQLVLSMFRAVEDRNVDRLLEIYDPDVVFVWPPELPYGGEHRADGVVAMSEAFAEAWDPVQRSERARRFNPRVLGSRGDEVVVLYDQRGEDGRGDTCETEVIGLYTVVGDRVTRLKMFYFDPGKITGFLAEALGR